MADDKGKVCSTSELDYYTGCCKGGELHACAQCNKLDSCCESFEHCVSCCMAPQNRPDERRREAPRWSPDPQDARVWADAFEYCMGTCRSHKGSTSHENTYIGPRHHCFSQLGKPLLSPPLPPGALAGVSVVLSAAGASCTSMCEQQGGACSEEHLHLLNSCDRLREVINCEAGCVAEAHEGFMPAAVDPEAPKASRPALCLTSKEAQGGSSSSSSKASFSCDASANYMRRLCPCIKGSSGSSSSGGKTKHGSKSVGDASSTDGSDAPHRPKEATQPHQQQGEGEEEAAAAAEVPDADAEGVGAGEEQQQREGSDGEAAEAAAAARDSSDANAAAEDVAADGGQGGGERLRR